MSRTRTFIPSLLLITLTSLTAYAEAPAWSQLAPEERQLLQALEESWESLPAERREHLLRGARRWLNLAPEDRARVQERFARWRALPPERRAAIRERYARFLALGPAQQRAVRRLFGRFQALPEARQEALRRRFENMSPEQRRSFLEGAELGRRLERQAGPRMPPSLAARARVLARDLGPPARAALRERLLGASRDERAALLTELERMNLAEREAFLLPDDS